MLFPNNYWCICWNWCNWVLFFTSFNLKTFGTKYGKLLVNANIKTIFFFFQNLLHCIFLFYGQKMERIYSFIWEGFGLCWEKLGRLQNAGRSWWNFWHKCKYQLWNVSYLRWWWQSCRGIDDYGRKRWNFLC